MLVESFVGITKKVTTYRSETNGIAEKAVRRVKEGTSALLVQSGLSEYGWREAMDFFCCLRNVPCPPKFVRTISGCFWNN